jgi:hypothetical protein
MDDKLCLDGMNTRNIDVGEGEAFLLVCTEA